MRALDVPDVELSEAASSPVDLDGMKLVRRFLEVTDDPQGV